ncbi:MAG: hypothetical protein IKR19_09745 [Acholeplasmatales bacterium]|nr:hypothetical protein [Acholeplasmatales bacterium]
MKYQINNFKISPKANLELEIKSKLKINNFKYKILLKSIDARDKSNIKLVYNLMIDTNDKIHFKNVDIYKEKKIELEYPTYPYDDRPIIVGFGPAGMFSALYLARCKARPIIIERGSKIEIRKEKVDDFLKNKVLSPNSNIQFGEGGAGTFSDGKLTTNLKDPLINWILNEFYLHGAKEDVIYDSKPHIGTDYLEKIVKNIRLEIESLGGEFYFDTKFIDAKGENDLEIYAKSVIDDKEYKFNTSHLLLGLGHSAKDTIRHLYNDMHINMEQKAFSMGVRIEHPKELIDKAQYGEFYKYLPAAYYKLSTHKNDRGIYTFCMCPGGYVMASQSDLNTIVVNGMSNNDRNSINSNSALLVDVKPSDYDNGNVLDGIDYQEKYEKLAYSLSNDYRAPSNLVKEFLNDEVASNLRSVNTTYPHGLYFTDLRRCLPDFVIQGLKDGIIDFDNKIKGFNHPDAILIGIESRSSCPIRILRNENGVSSIKGIYPIGEGAGYAGGITSAALDGLKCAIKIINGVKNE